MASSEKNVWIVVLAVAGALYFGPSIETRFFPVMGSPDNLQLKYVFPESLTTSLIEGKTTRNRNCDFRGLNWYIGTRGGRAAAVTVEFREGAKIRNAGVMEFGPWLVYATPAQLELNSYADALHQCYVSIFGWRIPYPWISQSPFYDPKPKGTDK